MARSPLRVLIAGGGVAGLEMLTALRGLAGDLVALTLIAPEDEFVYRPLAVDKPYAVGRMRSVGLDQAARDAGAEFVSGTIDAVDLERRTVRPSMGDPLTYDALVLAVGADAIPAVQHAMTWDDRLDAELLGGLLRDVEEGYTRRVAVVIPPGPGWPLRGYELALTITIQGSSMWAEVETTLVRPDPPPLALLGQHGVAVVRKEIERAGVAIAPADRVTVEPGSPITLVLQPSGERLVVDRVLAMPVLRGRPVVGIPADDHGLIEVDDHCRVRGVDNVWAVGDCTAFPLKSGGFSAEQADVAAEDIAALAGAQLEPRAFDPVVREELVGLPAGRYIEEWLAAGNTGLAMHLPSTGVPVLTYLLKDLAAGWRGR